MDPIFFCLAIFYISFKFSQKSNKQNLASQRNKSKVFSEFTSWKIDDINLNFTLKLMSLAKNSEFLVSLATPSIIIILKLVPSRVLFLSSSSSSSVSRSLFVPKQIYLALLPLFQIFDFSIPLMSFRRKSN